MFADYCAELGNKRSEEEGREYLAKARAYYQRVINRAQAVQHKRHVKTSDVRSAKRVYGLIAYFRASIIKRQGKDTIEVDTYQDVSAIARYLSLLKFT